MEKCYIAENVPVDTASKLATKAGVKALANGIRSQETKLLLKAGQYDNLATAVGKATENECENLSSISSFKTNRSDTHNSVSCRNSYQGQSNRHRGNQSQFRFQRGNSHFNQRNDQHFRRTYAGRGGYGQRGGNNNRGGYSSRGGNHFRGGYSHQNNRVSYNQAGNVQPPQHQNVGGPRPELPQQQQQQAPRQISLQQVSNQQ